MADYVTESGLLVTDRRTRADNLPTLKRTTVGPEAELSTTVMYPAEMLPPVQAWSGWPVEWATPTWGAYTGMTEMLNRVSTVWYCIDLNSAVLSTMPPYRTRGGELIPSVAWMNNPQPEVYNGWCEAFRQVVCSYYAGEAFLWATNRYADGSVREWVMLNPTWVQVDWINGRRQFSLGGQVIGLEGPGSDVLHIRYASWPGDARGHGPLEAAARNLISADALERYASDLAVRGGIPWAVLKVPGNLSSEQANAIRTNYVNARLSANGAPAILSAGAELQAMTINPVQMALLELQQWNAARIALTLGVPPFLAGLPSGGDPMTYSNASSIFDFHWRAFLRTKAHCLMEAISGWALPSGQTVELNRDEYVRPDLGDRATAYSTLFNIVDPVTGERAITVAEIRAAERFNATLTPPPVATSLAPEVL